MSDNLLKGIGAAAASVLRGPGHDLDVPEEERDAILAQLCQLTYFAEDIRNLLQQLVPTKTDPAGHGTAGTSPAGVSGNLQASPPAGLPISEFVSWTAPIIAKVLAGHMPVGDTFNGLGSCECAHSQLSMGDDEWQAHVSPLIAAAVGEERHARTKAQLALIRTEVEAQAPK